MQQNVKEVAICESGLFPCPYTEGKTFKTNPSITYRGQSLGRGGKS